jgi:hypothetical protein
MRFKYDEIIKPLPITLGKPSNTLNIMGRANSTTLGSGAVDSTILKKVIRHSLVITIRI